MTGCALKKASLNISVLLDVHANLPETSPFFVCPNDFGEHVFSNVYSTWDVQLWLGLGFFSTRPKKIGNAH